MAINPMQRKANNSFILGILITLLITGLIIGFLIMQLVKLNEEIETIKGDRANVYVLSQDVKSGELITGDMLKQTLVDSGTIPQNAITAAGDLAGYSLCDKSGNEINLYYDNNTKSSYYGILLPNSNTPKTLTEDTSTGSYYYEENGGKKYVEFLNEPLIAKVDLNKNTLLTSSLIKRGGLLTDDVRTQEYNIITLPSQLTTGDVIDVRLRLPDGQDYIVISHKEVTIPAIGGIESLDCIWLQMDETETLTMSAAIIEAYQMNGSKLYATKYVEAGNQDAATPTYLPPDKTLALMQQDPNALTEAKRAIFERNNNSNYKSTIRTPINNAVNNDDAEDNVQDGVQTEIQGLQEQREKYLDSL